MGEGVLQCLFGTPRQSHQTRHHNSLPSAVTHTCLSSMMFPSISSFTLPRRCILSCFLGAKFLRRLEDKEPSARTLTEYREWLVLIILVTVPGSGVFENETK